MPKISIYHNPRCSKSRSTLRLIEESGAQTAIVDYLKTPPNAEDLATICKKLEVDPKAIIRSKESLFKELCLSLKDERSEAEWLEILAANPKLIDRPIVVKGSQAIIGRPPENVLALL